MFPESSHHSRLHTSLVLQHGWVFYVRRRVSLTPTPFTLRWSRAPRNLRGFARYERVLSLFASYQISLHPASVISKCGLPPSAVKKRCCPLAGMERPNFKYLQPSMIQSRIDNVCCCRIVFSWPLDLSAALSPCHSRMLGHPIYMSGCKGLYQERDATSEFSEGRDQTLESF